MYSLNHRPPGALPPFQTFALTARCGLAALPRVSLTSFAVPRAMNSPSCGGRGMAFSHPPPRKSFTEILRPENPLPKVMAKNRAAEMSVALMVNANQNVFVAELPRRRCQALAFFPKSSSTGARPATRKVMGTRNMTRMKKLRYEPPSRSISIQPAKRPGIIMPSAMKPVQRA